MATIDLSGYRMTAKRGRLSWYLDIRPATQGQVTLGDTLILREGETYSVRRVGEPYLTRSGAEEVTLYLDPIN